MTKTFLSLIFLASLAACSSTPVTDADRAHMREVEKRTPSGVIFTNDRGSANRPSRGIDKR